MTITILTGLPGSGKSESLISQVNQARQSNRNVLTFFCSDSPILRSRPNLAKGGRMGCRSGLSTTVDHFVSIDKCVALVNEAQRGSLLAFDEAQHFGDRLVDFWCAAAERGVEILIASPNQAQLEALRGKGYASTLLPLDCQVCGQHEATKYFCHLDEDRTESVCNSCHDRLCAEVQHDVVERLQRGAPYPGEKWIYQPVELDECADWNVVREDTDARVDIILDICRRQGLPQDNSTYLDVGCNTGYLCHRLSQSGFRCTGVDVTANDIEVARLLGSYMRRDSVAYIQSDAHDYLANTQDESIDVTSAFSVFQWVMIQKTPNHGLDCMRWLFRKTARVCFLEMGESTEAHYVERIGMRYDRSWIHEFICGEGGFERVDVIDAALLGIKRDIFVGYKPD